jgi:hypothetical protein
MPFKKGFVLTCLLFLSGCVAIAANHYETLFGPAQTQQREIVANTPHAEQYLNDVKPIIEQRCVVCHGCYDAPCQLKLSSPEGIDRGLSKVPVYDGTRLLAQTPSRLLIDATSTQQWRDKGFTAVLNEHQQSADANLAASVMYRSLLLKQNTELPAQQILGDEFDFSLDRTATCPSIEEFDSYAQHQSHAGMPYGLPALEQSEFAVLHDWLKNGAKMAQIAPPTLTELAQIEIWEAFLNQDSLKARLSARYIYEHWYLANIYFDEANKSDSPSFFKLVRSKTPPGQAVEIIATRRPFDEPNVERVYYRFQHQRSTVLSKTHMPLAINKQKLARLKAQFIEADYQVSSLPGYAPEVASNPFKSFAQLPVKSKYQFMLDEAHLIISGFIKGPVCRGQIALNVINDHFWVAFVDPDKNSSPKMTEFLIRNDDELALPAAEQSNALPLSSWAKYAKRQHEYLNAKTELANQVFADGSNLTTDLIWQGEGHNRNAALTVFRHFDSATVVKGFVGQAPKTMWLLDYALFERIHYLLVAGFDVYGNVGHQLITRLYMDFLRLEGEQNFINLLPQAERQKVKNHWYRKSHLSLSEFINRKTILAAPTGMQFTSAEPKLELYSKFKQHLKPILSERHAYNLVPKPLSQLNALPSRAINLLPQVSFILVKHGEQHKAYTLIHHNAHYNISSLLNEEGQRAYDEDTATLVPGFIGDYPEAIWYLPNSDHVQSFVENMHSVQSEADYRALKQQFAIRRSHPQFWQYSDLLHEVAKQYKGIEYGVFDYNRLENR